MDRIALCRTTQEMVALVPALLAFEDGAWSGDFAHIWARQWTDMGFGPFPKNVWPLPDGYGYEEGDELYPVVTSRED